MQHPPPPRNSDTRFPQRARWVQGPQDRSRPGPRPLRPAHAPRGLGAGAVGTASSGSCRRSRLEPGYHYFGEGTGSCGPHAHHFSILAPSPCSPAPLPRPTLKGNIKPSLSWALELGPAGRLRLGGTRDTGGMWECGVERGGLTSPQPGAASASLGVQLGRPPPACFQNAGTCLGLRCDFPGQ